MNSSAPNTNLAFSTITKKAPLASQNQNVAQSQTVTKFKDLIASRDKEYITIADPQAKYNVNTDPLRQSLVFGPSANVDFSLYKKSKKTGKTLQRTAKLAQSDILHILQDKNRKLYNTPSQLTPETYTEFQQRMTASTAAQKKLLLPWAPKTAGTADYRIAFVRRPVAGAEAKLDSAFYFNTKEDFEKAKNYLKFIELLEAKKTGTPPHVLLNNLNQAFKGQLAAKFRKLMLTRANQARAERLIQKENLVRNTNLLLTSNANLTKSLSSRWLKFARDRDYLKKEQDRAVKDRIENLSNTIKRSSLILTLNSYLVGAMLEAWKNEAEARIQSYKEDIALYLDCIEISSSIIQPSLKVEVTLSKEYPDDLRINNTRIREKTLERTLDFRLNCRIKGPKIAEIAQNTHTPQTPQTPQVYYWNIVPAEVLPTDRSSQYGQYGNVQEELFALRFNEYILEHLDLVEIRFLLSDESETVRAYQYVPLKSLYAASKKGNNVWLSLNTSHKGNLSAPLLHIKTFSNRVDHSNENVFNVETAGTSNLETIQDAFYDYQFNMPAITPKHDKILELLPASWNVIDEKTKTLKRTDKFGPFVNTVKAKLAKHYYETTSRQLARLRKSAQIWATLQDELTSYIPKKVDNNVSQLYVDERYIKNLAGLQKPVIEEGNGDEGVSQEFQEEYNGIVSYLFKRDKWESKEEWYSFYQKLGALCKKGLPPQHRINIWSEMSRVVYFVNLTENEHKKQRGVKYYQQAYLNQDMNDRSRTVDNIYKKSKIVYEQLKKDAEKEFIYLYQELEDDLEFLREQYESTEKQKIPYERNIRNICRTFIFWSKLFSDPSTEEKIRYFVTYSRAILILCHGLITCQTCSYMEQEVIVEEEQVFWNLISLATYILSSYFETNEDSVSVDKLTFKEGEERKKNKITNSALRCNQIKGIKGDLLILKILLKEYEPEIYYKFEELGLPLEFYFADHMLTLFFNLFNPGLTFRIWDVLFFEGSSANQVRCNRMIVCFLFVLLRDCKAMLLKAKKASDINFVIETYAKFQTKYGAFIKKAYVVSKDYFEQALPRDQTFFEKLSYIRYALFTSDYNKLDKKIRGIEQSIEANYFTFTLQQNMALFALTNSKYQYRPEADLETLSYTVLARMIKEFQSEFGVKTSEAKIKDTDYMIDEPDKKRYKLFQDVNIDTRKFLKGRMSTLHFRIHSLVTYWPNLEDLSVVVVYGKDRQKKKDLQNFNVEFEGVFSLNNSREIPRYLNLEIVDERDPMNPQKVKYLSIDLKRIAFEVPTKLNLKFREENPNIYNNNHITSEVELTLLLEGAEAAHDVKIDYGLFFTVPELENPVYDTFRDKDFSQTVTAGHNDDEGEVERPTYHGGASFLRDRHNWKENFAVDYEEFLKIMKQIAPFWINNADLSKIYDTISKANRNNTFYITDFFVLLVLFGKFTSIQKFGLLFDLFTGFDDTFTDKTREVPYHVLKGLCAYIFDLFMIYMPYNELENIVDLTVYGDIANIKKVTVNGEVTIKNDVIKQHLNRLSNFMHASYNTKELHLYQAPVLDILRSVYEKEIKRNFDQPINKIEIIYVTNGLSHKLRFDIDENWKIVEDADGRKSAKAGARVLGNYRNVISLQNTPKIFSRNEFIKVMQKLPLVNYLCSLEHTEISNTLVYLNNIKFTINMEGESVYTVAPTHEPIPKQILTNDDLLRNKKKDFRTVLREWDDILRISGYRAGSNSNLRSSRSNFRGNKMKQGEAQKIASSKLNLFFSHNQLISYIKRTIIKSISETIQKSGQVDQFNPLLFNKNLWELDYTVTLSVNKNREFDINDKKKSPFKTLVELMERTSNIDRDIEEVEIVYNFKPSTIPEAFVEPYGQLALYRYAEGSTEWLPCKIKYKFEYVRRDEGAYYNQDRETIDGFGVVFSKFPDETVLKKSSEVAIIKMVDFEELELKQVDPLTSKAITVDRGAAGFSPQRQQQQGGPKVLFQKPSDDDDNLFGSNPQGSAYSGQKVRSGMPGLYDGVPRDNEDEFGGKLKVTH